MNDLKMLRKISGQKTMFERFLTGLGYAVFMLFSVLVLALLMAYPTKWLVNYIFTDGVRLAIFGVAKIGVWQALALNYMCGILFKGTSASSK